MRIHSPTAWALPNNSVFIFRPITATEVPRRGSPAGRNRPIAISQCRTSLSSAVEPNTGTSRSKPPQETPAEPTTTGAIFSTAELRFSAIASSIVRSRGVSPASMPGAPPVVSDRPGITMIRCVPSDANSPVTKRRAPSPSEVRTTTAATPIAIASRSMAVRKR